MNSDEAEKCFEKGMSLFNNSDYPSVLKTIIVFIYHF